MLAVKLMETLSRPARGHKGSPALSLVSPGTGGGSVGPLGDVPVRVRAAERRACPTKFEHDFLLIQSLSNPSPRNAERLY